MSLRSPLIFLTILLSICQVFTLPLIDDLPGKIDRELRPKLSLLASISHSSLLAPRWSDYHAPRPGTIVNVATENDVVETVKYCIKNNLDFLAQGGGHGWTTTFNIDQKDVIINMRGLNQVSVSKKKDKITFGGGALVSEVVQTAYLNQVQAMTPNGNCIGITGAILGGGIGRLNSYYGLAIDGLLSVNLVTAEGKLITVSPNSSRDLWWAIRGAGANFGIVTSATIKAYKPVNNNVAWIADLIFTPDKVEVIAQTLSDFKYTKKTYAFLFFVPSPTSGSPIINVNLWYLGSEAEGKAVYKAIYDLGPVSQTSQIVPYNQWNAGFDYICVKGGRKPSYTAGLNKLDPQVFRNIWEEYSALLAENPALIGTAIVMELYSSEKLREVSGSGLAYAHRDVNFHGFLVTGYGDASLDPVAENFGEKIRELWQESSGLKDLRAYVNYGHGDEGAKAFYGKNLDRLRKLKRVWDRFGRFSQYNPVSN